MQKPNILASNDDGVYAPGIAALADALRTVGTVTVVAPSRERSAASHSLTMDVPLRASRIAEGVVSVEGTPTDCVLLAVKNLLAEPPDILVSGVNRGPNVGDDVTYSGTVAAAIEGTILGIPSIAVSLDRSPSGKYDYRAAAEVARQMMLLVLERGLPAATLLNVNVPNVPAEEIKGIELARLGKQTYEDSIIQKTDPRGRLYYWIGGQASPTDIAADTDIAVVARGAVSVTPIELDLTDYAAMEILRTWPLERVLKRRAEGAD
jgi:5'-nucleotidase